LSWTRKMRWTWHWLSWTPCVCRMAPNNWPRFILNRFQCGLPQQNPFHIQFPIPSVSSNTEPCKLHDCSYITTIVPISPVQERVKTLLWAFKSASASHKIHEGGSRAKELVQMSHVVATKFSHLLVARSRRSAWVRGQPFYQWRESSSKTS